MLSICRVADGLVVLSRGTGMVCASETGREAPSVQLSRRENQSQEGNDRRRDVASRVGGLLFVNAYGQSSQGTARKVNLDHFLIATFQRQLEVVQTSLDDRDFDELDHRSQGWVFMVADGAGGRAAGMEASSLTIQSSLRYLRSAMPWFMTARDDQAEVVEAGLRSVVRRCHEELMVLSAGQSTDRRWLGTTLTMTYVLWPHAYVVHVGDSRCYLIRGNLMRQLTRDHTLAQDLLRRTDLAAELADRSPLTEVLTRHVGGGRREALEPEVCHVELEHRDIILLCTDGLSKVVPDQTIQELVGHETYANARCQALLEAAHEAGGTDNATVITASFARRPS
jgi:protein phosphatase